MRCGGKSDIQRTVNGKTQSDSIANIFANQYEELYTSVGYDEVEMDGLRRDIDDKVNDVGYDSNCIIKFADIINAVSKLKPGKHDGHFALSSDYVIY
jgi:hypothetical protein